MLFEYISVLVYLLFSLVLSSVIIIASMFLVLRDSDSEKISSYECGFHPFEDSRTTFDVRFYLVSILFIIFDLEVMFLFPWSLVIFDIGFMGYLSVMFFLFILVIGFFYEWKKGGLDWE